MDSTIETIINFDNLTSQQSRQYDNIVSLVEVDYNEIIGEIYKDNEGIHNWYFSTLASRSPFQSTLFERLCIIKFLKKYNNTFPQRITKVLLSDYFLFKTLKKSDEFSNKFYFTGGKISFFQFYLKTFKNFAKYIFVILVKLLVSNIYKKKKFGKNNPLMLIDTFVFSGIQGAGTINTHGYSDRYFPGLIKNMNYELAQTAFYVPTLLIDRKLLSTFFKICKNKQFIVKESYLKLKDWLCVLKIPFQRININDVIKYNDLDVRELIKEELSLSTFNLSKLIAEINYRFIKNAKLEGINIKYHIDWYENQVIDRGMILSLKKYYPDVKVCGYQGFIVCPRFNFYLFPTNYEIEHSLTPDIIAVIGKCLLSSESRHYNVDTILAPAFRFQHLYETRGVFPCKEKFAVLIPFSICLKSSLDNLEMITQALSKCKNRDDFTITVKLHPSCTGSSVVSSINRINSNAIVSNNEFCSELQRSHILIGSATSACVEALVYDVKIIIIANKSGISSNPIPEKFSYQCEVVYDQAELIDELSSFKVDSQEKKHISTEDKLNELFCPVNRLSVKKFISELNF